MLTSAAADDAEAIISDEVTDVQAASDVVEVQAASSVVDGAGASDVVGAGASDVVGAGAGEPPLLPYHQLIERTPLPKFSKDSKRPVERSRPP